MLGQAYAARRGEIRTYFDRTAVEAWKRFASQAPMGRIRASVREGRGRMRAAMLGLLPADLSGWRVLDAGCGTGAMSVELARRGADVLGIDLAPEIVRFAAETLPPDIDRAKVRFEAGDMLAGRHGRFDAVVAMDSLIHYAAGDAVAALAELAERVHERIVFTFAPKTLPLALMHGVGRFFPRADRAPAIQPVGARALSGRLADAVAPFGWCVGETVPISHGFYKSQAMQLKRPEGRLQ